jgi:hypothetical protein
MAFSRAPQRAGNASSPLERGVSIALRSATHCYEGLVALRVADQERLGTQLQKQGQVILAIDGL